MRTIRVALFELAAAVRTRRAIVLVALYLAASLLGMSGAITALGKMEDRLAEILQVEKVEGKSKFESFNIAYNIECKHIDEQSKVSHAVQLATDKYCGGLAMLRKIAPVSHSISIVSVEVEA